MCPALERRPDGLVEVVDPGGGKQQGFRERPEMLGMSAQDEGANLLGVRRATGLPGDENRLGVLLQPGSQPLDLGRLARALPAFEGDKQPAIKCLRSRS
jgi:hypothetical protein